MNDEGQPPRRRPRPYQEKQRARPDSDWTRFLPLIALLVFLATTGITITALYSWLLPAGDPVSVPDFIGQSFDGASAAADAAHLHLRIIARRPEYHSPKDVVVGQLPAAGERVRSGRTIDVIVSSGIPTVKTPNLSNLSLRDAQLALENARLELGTVQKRLDGDVLAGQVLDQNPDAFTQVQAGSKVNVIVAEGRPLIYTPNFVGLSLDFVKTAAQDAHVGLGAVHDLAIAPSAPPKGIVVAQDPAAGEILQPHQRVSLQVSGGAPPTPTPSPTPLPLESAEAVPSVTATPALPSPAGQRFLRVSVVLPKSETPQAIRVVLLDATGSRVLFSQTTTGGISLSFDVNVTGAASIETYSGDNLISTTPL